MSEEIRFDPQPKQVQFLKSSADITIFGGAAGGGKTWSLLYKPMYYTANQDFGGVIFRRTYPQITVEGGLWDESDKLYPFAGATSTKGALRWTFPSGATVVFRSMENEDDYRNFDGSQIPYIGFDQLESFTAKQFWYMMSRNRSTSGVRPIIRASCNPQPGWLADLIQWWWDPDTGYAIPERSGIVRWFVRIGDGIRWFATKEEAIQKHPAIPPKSLTFIFSKLNDNQVLMKADPGYLANLMALPLVERERLLGGNWKISVAGNIFKREWWKFVDQPPAGIFNWCRYWDLAATVPKPGKEPDWTAGVKLGELNGNIYIADCVHFQGSSLTNERTIKATAELDGPAVMVRMEQEGGASGKSLAGEEGHYARNILVGYDFNGVPSSKKKLLRWAPLSAAAEHGRVFIVKGKWNQDFVDELEGCKGEDEKNDQCLVAGTMVACERGLIAIEDIRAGDRVYTRGGLRSVVWSGLTGFSNELMSLETSGGRKITCTKKHVVFFHGKGFIELDAACGALETICLKNTNQSGLTGSSSVETRTQKERVIAVTSLRATDTSAELVPFTGKFGNTTMELFRKGLSFITETATRQTTTSEIYNWSRLVSIWKYIAREATGILETQGVLKLSIDQGLRQRNGMEARMGWIGIARTVINMDLFPDLQPISNVSTVGRYSNQQLQTQSAAHINAQNIGASIFRKIRSALFASNAELSLSDSRSQQDGNPMRQSFAETPADLNGFKGKGQPVYNLKVEGCPEFFANGILVHNCDAASGALEALRVPTGAWSGADVAASSTGYERPRGEALDAFEFTVDATED